MIENQKSVIEELEKIKAEIEELKKDWDKFDNYRKKNGLYYAELILDNHIAELKGEQE